MQICRAIFILILIMVSLSFSSVSSAAGMDNAGFRKDISPELKERFGICDEFLDVKWVSAAALKGMLKADVHMDGKTEQRYLVVTLERPGNKSFSSRGNGIFYEAGKDDFEKEGFEAFLKGASFSFTHENVFMNIKKGKRSERYPQEPLPFEAFVDHKAEFPNRSFSRFTKTVCVAYPDERRVFIVEVKKPFMARMDAETKKAYEAVAKSLGQICADLRAKNADAVCSTGRLDDAYALRVNSDSKDDYIVLVAGKKGDRASGKRYMLRSEGAGYSASEVTGCLGFSRFFYGTADARGFKLGSCQK